MNVQEIDAKQIGLTTLLGAGVIVGTSLITPLLSGLGIGLLDFAIVPNVLTVGSTLAAGTSAFVIDLAITKWLS